MFRPRIRNVFKSRWQAVFWSASILLTAYCTVPAADHAAPTSQADHPAKHANPWAKGAK